MSTAPVNIPARKSDIKGNCENKCFLSFNYQSSTCIVKNKGKYLSLGYENNDSKITFNSSSYKVIDIRLYTPSLHRYNSDKSDAELMVIHKNNKQEILVICVPVKKTMIMSPASSLFSQIIGAAPIRSGQSASANVNNFSLNFFVPKATYHFYQAKLPWDRRGNDCNFIVFNPKDSNSTISPETFILLNKLINKNNYEPSSNIDIFYNKTGVSSSGEGGESDIYIDCSPIIKDSEKIDYKTITDSSTSSFTDLLRSNSMKLFGQALILLAIFTLIFYGFRKLLASTTIRTFISKGLKSIKKKRDERRAARAARAAAKPGAAAASKS